MRRRNARNAHPVSVLLTNEQQIAQMIPAQQAGMRFERRQSLPNGYEQIWLCEVLGILPAADPAFAPNTVYVLVLEASTNVPGARLDDKPFNYTFQFDEVKRLSGVEITPAN